MLGSLFSFNFIYFNPDRYDEYERENILSLLAPFEQLTEKMSSSDASVADVIALIAALKRLLGKEVETHHKVKTMKSRLIKSVSKHFTGILCTSLVLDPHYRDPFLGCGNEAAHTRNYPAIDLNALCVFMRDNI